MKKRSVSKRSILLCISVILVVAIVLFLFKGGDRENPKIKTQIANPASEKCIELGGRVEIREDETGEYGVCVKRENECEEWELFRGECDLDDKEYFENECILDEECVPASCCHASSCVNKKNAPKCEEVMCTMECRLGSIDCGQGSCKCVDKKCVAVFD